MSFSTPPAPAAPAAPPPIPDVAPPMTQAQGKSNQKRTPNPTIIGARDISAQPLTLMGPGSLGRAGGQALLGS